MQNVIIKSAVSMSGRLELATPASSFLGNNLTHSFSKRLLSAVMLAFMLVCGGTAWGQELTSYGKAEINAAPTSTTDETAMTITGSIVGAWYKNAASNEFTYGGKEITKNEVSKWFVKLTDQGYIKIRVAKGSVVAGDILRVEVVDIYQDSNNALGFKVDGSDTPVTYTGNKDNDIHTIDYTLKTGDIRVDPENDENDYIQIDRNGADGFKGCGYHSVEILKPDGYVVTFSANSASTGWGTVSATVDGNPIESGARVAKNAKVQFTATPSSADYRHWGWDVDGKRDWSFPNPYTITQDVKIEANFTPGIKINAYPNNGSLGTVNISGGGENGTSIHISPYPGTVTFTATPNDNVRFMGWFSNEACTTLITTEKTLVYKDSDPADDLRKTGTINRWAKFVRTIGRPYCNHAERPNGEKSGDNYFALDQMNAGPNVTIENAAEGSGKTVTVSGSQNSYISFNLAQAYKFTDLKGWTISDIEAVRSGVNGVEFLKDGNSIVTFNNSAGNRSLEGDGEAENRKKLDVEVDEIRIHFIPGTYTFPWIRFKFEHDDRVDPVLSEGTAAEMEIFEGEDLILANNSGYWRQYTDNTYQTTTNGLVPTNEWKTRYEIAANNLTVGSDYYFGVRDAFTCGLGYYHTSEFVKVHVHVKELPKCTVTTEENSSDKVESSVNVHDGKLDIRYEHEVVDGKKAVVQVNNTANVWNDHDNITCDGFRMTKANNTELLVNAPAGYRVKFVRVNFCKESKYNLSFNGGSAIPQGTGKYVEYTQNATNQYKNMVRMVIRAEAGEDEKELHIKSVDVKVERMCLDEDRVITSSDRDRRYWLYVPENVMKGKVQNVPVVFSLHGGSESYLPTNNNNLNFNSLADQNNFIVVYPCAEQQTFPYFNPAPSVAWLATGSKNTDTQLFEDIIEALKTNTDGFTIDEKKIYMAGFSVGGMMVYATANCLSDKFAAFASISGLPMNELHLRHHGARPVPFLHVHGTKDNFVNYRHMPTIVDNMVARNGLSYVPTETSGTADIYGNAQTTYHKYVYGNEADKTATPYIYYQIGTGMTSTDTGMGHNDWCRIGSDDVEKVMWDFFNGRSLPANLKSDIVFAPQVNTSNSSARNHGWEINSGSRIIAQYGESGGYTSNGQNVYHTIQLNSGTHSIQFNANRGEKACDVIVRIYKLGDLSHFDALDIHNGFTVNETLVLEKAYQVKNDKISIPFDATDGEYRLTIMRKTQGDNVTISNVQIVKGSVEQGTPAEGELSTDFAGYFNYNNRLFAQWNFDLCDGFRFNGRKIQELLADGNDSNDAWQVDLSNTDYATDGEGNVIHQAANGTLIYKYIKPLGTQDASDEQLKDANHYAELTYDGSISNAIPVSGGLKFNAPAEHVKVYVDLANGQVTGTHLVVDEHVKLLVPYVTNSYRNDKGNVTAPQDNKADFENCMHHIKRDILYIALNQGSVWDVWANGNKVEDGHVKNVRIDAGSTVGLEAELLGNGGDEYVNGKTYYKGDYRGTVGVPCVLQFNKETIIDRIGVNRNLIYSFYTEYIKELGLTQPKPGTRIIGSPSGAKIANTGEWADYNNAVTMTFGGWQGSETNRSYSQFDLVDGNVKKVTDEWDELGIFNGQATVGGSDVFANFSNLALAPESNVTAAIDGFPVISKIMTAATSEQLMPSNTPSSNKYHPANNGKLSNSYEANVTPWTLPCRGAYLKFEPTLPGVLNIDIVQMGGHNYYIADEFGMPVTENAHSKSASKQTVTQNNGVFSVAKTDYVKHSLNVYPGKTYYVFSNDAGIGFTGFYFEPYVYRPAGGGESDRIDVELGTLTLDDNSNYAYPTGDALNAIKGERSIKSPKVDNPSTDADYVFYPIKKDNRAVNIRYNRTFTANTWTTICLPYSINQTQMEDAFGEGTRVVLLRDIQDSSVDPSGQTTIHFIMHENQDIIAGYPYLICPTKTVSSITTKAYLSEVSPHIPSIVSDNQYEGVKGYTFKGTFDRISSIEKGSYGLATSGNLTRITNDNVSLKPYRAYLAFTGDDYTKAKQIQAVAYGNKFIGEENDEATAIEDILMEAGIAPRNLNVYSINGQIVRQNTTSLQSLPKGMYIINGKKYLVK